MIKKLAVLTTLFLIVYLPALTIAQDDIPRTSSGKPYFSGNYDISTLTPLERPSEFGDRLVLSPEEVQAIRDREMDARSRGSSVSDPDRAAPARGADVGNYNDFWYQRGNDGFSIDGQYRTSILTYPENGRFPALTVEGEAKTDKAPKFSWPEQDAAWWLETGDQPYDGPENFTLSVRCIFNLNSTGILLAGGRVTRLS